MTRLQTDFLGPFVECNGAINRPPTKTGLNLAGKLVATHIRYSPTVRVRDDAGGEEVWHACGQVGAYKEARDTLPQAEFERFAALACGPEFSRLATSRALYPQMAKLYPSGIDYLSEPYKSHAALSDQLQNAEQARRHAGYVAKAAAQKAAPSGPAPVRVRATSAAEVMKSLAVAGESAPAPAAPRKKVKP